MRQWLAGMMLFAVAAFAQEGYPLDGTWRGEYAAADGAHQTIVLVMQWDGQKIVGTINPGPDATDFVAAELLPEGWRVTFSGKTAAGKPLSFAGALSQLGKYNRVLSGKWSEGTVTHDIRFVRE
jgi:hypothetical protein